MADAKKDRKRLTDLSQPLQMAELNRQMDWIWSQLMGNLPEKALSGEVRTTIADASGNASEALQTAQGLSTRVTNAEGDASEALQTANGLSTRVTNAQNTASQALQTANGFSARITNAEGDIAALEFSLSGVTASIEGGRLEFSSSGLVIKDANGNVVLSQDISTGDLNITGDITATSGTIGGFTINNNSIVGANGTSLHSDGEWSAVNGLVIRYFVDSQQNYVGLIGGRDGAAITDFRICQSVQFPNSYVFRWYNDYTTGRNYTYIRHPRMELGVVSGVQPNLYIDADGNVSRILD